jgi:hypothetical protein
LQKCVNELRLYQSRFQEAIFFPQFAVGLGQFINALHRIMLQKLQP